MGKSPVMTPEARRDMSIPTYKIYPLAMSRLHCPHPYSLPTGTMRQTTLSGTSTEEVSPISATTRARRIIGQLRWGQVQEHIREQEQNRKIPLLIHSLIDAAVVLSF